MNLTLSMRPILGYRLSLFIFFFFLLTAGQSFGQVQTDIVYANSGLPNTVASGNSTDVFAGSPVIGGLTHTTVSSLPSITFGIPPMWLLTNPPGFDGTALWLGSSFGYSNTSTGATYAGFVTDLINLNYNFVPGYNYNINISYSCNTPNSNPGLGLSFGPPQAAGGLSACGAPMVSRFTNYPSSGTIDGLEDEFLNNPYYSSFFSFGSSPTFTDLAIPAFSVPAATTGLNLEVLPTNLSPAASYMEIQSITIAGIPPITPTVLDVCTSQTYSINSSWPVTWSVSPAGVASITPSGNSVTLTKTGDGNATLTASLTSPNGRIYTVDQLVHLPGPPADFGIQAIVPCISGRIVTPATFNAVPAEAGVTYHWSYTQNGVTNTIPGTTSSISKKFNLGTYEIQAYASNTCGESDEASTEFNVLSCSGGQSAASAVQADSATSLIDDGSAGGIKVSPNPASGILTVSAQQDIREIRIIDKIGQLVRRQLFPAGTTLTTINLAGIQPDMYILQVNNGKTRSSKKIIVTK